MFISGLAQTNIFPASNTYCVDSMPELAGDAIGSSYFTRYLAAALASAVCLKSINKIGVGWTCTYSAALLWIGFLCAVYLVKYGEDSDRIVPTAPTRIFVIQLHKHTIKSVIKIIC
ncbi:hypothetical protein QCA50_018728 [Cerrena zonata]|uniref:Uncharacterized protein n=1 Tax=Cerrena zonata TaxID=2478898 RepID=A0AAW0FG66_9APHY